MNISTPHELPSLRHMPIPRLRSWLANPVCLLALAAGLIAFAAQSGELGSADTQHRLHSTHSFWTSDPPVFPDEYPEFGIHGRDGKLQSWYGIGQSLLMLPADVVGTYVERLPAFADYYTDPIVKNIFVSYTTNILLNVLTALVAFRFLRQLNFSITHSVAGVLVFLVATTHLHYTQNMMENNYICLLTLTGFCYQHEWLLTNSRRALLIGSAAFGLNLLTRLTTGLDLLAGAGFMLLLCWFEGTDGTEFWRRTRTYIATAFPIYAVFVLLDRLYQYYRFGSFFNTYVTVFSREMHQREPSLPAKYPWETPFHVGFFGALFKPEKSIFLFDPLLILMVVLAVVAWKWITPDRRAYIITSFALLLAYISFYARYTIWTGDFAWGDRYVSTTAELATLLAVPLLLTYRAELGKAVWIFGISITATSVLIQAASLAFWLSLEIYQMETLGHPTFVIALRFKNIVAFALGKMDAWGLVSYAMHWDEWDYVHITCWNFLPFVLKRAGVAPLWVVHLTLAIWITSLVLLAATLWRLYMVLTGPEYTVSQFPLRTGISG